MTPIQQLKERIKKSNAVCFTYDMLQEILDEHIIIEKQTIKDAFQEGEMNIWNKERDGGFEFEHPEDYYNKTFKTE